MKRMLFGLLFLACCTVPVFAQRVTIIQVEQWVVVHYGQVAQGKVLPLGFHDFRPVPADLGAMSFVSDGCVMCREMKNAISYGKRLWLNYTPDAAVAEITRLNGNNVLCGYVPGLTLRAIEFAIRGDDKGRPIYIVKWVDNRGEIHYTGIPKFI